MAKGLRGGKRTGHSSIADDNLWPYGEDYYKVAQDGEVAYVKVRGGSVTAPMETRTRGRVYATLDINNDVKHITFYDLESGERTKQIDVKGKPHNGAMPHVHLGYDHDEYGSRVVLTSKEEKTVRRILDYWENKRKKLNM